MLAAIEAGDESCKRFDLAADVLPRQAASVFRLVAAIPCGYACSYGRIAEAARTTARAVGQFMATNPLYPIVPCHRVVGSDFSLVGYRGMTSGPDLEDKLARLRAEARGFSRELTLEDAHGLRVFPVEWVIAKADRERGDDLPGMTLL
jgi:O-6-methylguanine DNA methyltransferase